MAVDVPHSSAIRLMSSPASTRSEMCPRRSEHGVTPVRNDISGSRSGRAGHFERRIPEARALYASHWRAVERALHEHMPDGCRWSEPAGGFFTWLSLPGIDTTAMRAAALEAGVAYVPGAPFYPGDGGRDELRLSFSFLREEELGTAVARLAGVVRETTSTAAG